MTVSMSPSVAKSKSAMAVSMQADYFCFRAALRVS
jgi:hypothetical protein